MSCWLPLRRTVVALASLAVTGACASTGAVPQPFPASRRPQPEAAAAHVGRSISDTTLVESALALRGVPYKEGGSGPEGFDCSGFTQYVYAQVGVALPREVREQFEQGISVKVRDVAPGDLLFFTTVAPGPTHVAIALGGDQFVHAPSSTGVVRIERLSARYWASRYLGARRPNYAALN
jgi:cell wall-associated NlpC family hydrolase